MKLEIPVWEPLIHKQQLDPQVDEINERVFRLRRGEVRHRGTRCQHLGGGQIWANHKEDRDREGRIRKKAEINSGGQRKLEIGQLVECY